jgi:histidyl-tRNA synthetase
MGIDRILLAAGLDGSDVVPLDLFVVVASPELRDTAAAFLSQLRRAGVRADMVSTPRSVKAQFRTADRRGASGVAVVGEEWDSGRVAVRDLGTGTQEFISFEEVAEWAKSNR